MGRLPIQGVAWYRKKLTIPAADKDKFIYLDIDGAMSYAIVWLNGHLVGGWPYGYNSFRLDLTPYIKAGGDNTLAIRLDNPTNSARWYPGAGIYRNVWLTKVNPVHVARWGTFISARNVSASSATVDMIVRVANKAATDQTIEVATEIYTLNADQEKRKKVVTVPVSTATVKAGAVQAIENMVTLQNPLLWGPPPAQKPHLYIAVTSVRANGNVSRSV